MIRLAWGVFSVVFTIVGFAGVPDDIRGWGEWVQPMIEWFQEIPAGQKSALIIAALMWSMLLPWRRWWRQARRKPQDEGRTVETPLGAGPRERMLIDRINMLSIFFDQFSGRNLSPQEGQLIMFEIEETLPIQIRNLYTENDKKDYLKHLRAVSKKLEDAPDKPYKLWNFCQSYIFSMITNSVARRAEIQQDIWEAPNL